MRGLIRAMRRARDAHATYDECRTWPRWVPYWFLPFFLCAFPEGEPVTGPCPSALELEQLALREESSDAARARGIRAHVARCEACREMLEEIRENQRFLGHAAGALGDALDSPRAGTRRDGTPGSDPDLSALRSGRAPPASGSVRGFELLEEISRGGQGVVYRAVQTATKRPAAVKMLLGGVFATERQRQRFEREIEIAARLRHPNIVSVFESGTTSDGSPYVAMEFVEGVPLDRFVRERHADARRSDRGRIDEAVRLVGMIASGVGHAHTSGVIHRDLKPSNILVDGEGKPRVLDFGLARPVAASRDVSTTREFVGTPAYASPEQMGGDPASVDARADVYALGLILYNMLTGKHPYPCDGTLAELARHAISTEPTPPSGHVARLPTDVETIVMKCLAKDPARRYPNASALASDIDDYLDGRPISARRDSTMYVLRKLAFRHRIPALAGGLVLLTIIAATIGLALLARDLDHAQRGTVAALSDSNIQHARLMGAAGDIGRAESLLWSGAIEAGMPTDGSLLIGGTPETLRSAWSLAELYARLPRLFRARSDIVLPRLGLDMESGRVWAEGANGERRTWSFDCSIDEYTAPKIVMKPGVWPEVVAGGEVVVRYDGSTIVAFNLRSGATIVAPTDWPGHLPLADVSPRGDMIATAPFKGQGAVGLFRLPSLEPIATFDDRAHSAQFQQIGGDLYLITGFCEFDPWEVRVRKAPDWELAWTIRMAPDWVLEGTPMRWARVKADKSQFLTTIGENLVMADLTRPDAPIVSRWAGGSAIQRVSIDEQWSRIVVGTMDGCVSRLELPDLALVTTHENIAGISGIAASDDWWIAAVSDTAKRISVYEMADRPWLSRFTSLDTNSQCIDVAIDGTVAWAEDDGDIIVARTDSQAPVRIARAHVGVINSVAFSRDGRQIVSAGNDGAVRLWSAEGSPIRVVSEGHPNLWSARFSPDGRRVACGTRGGLVLVFDLLEQGESLVINTGAERIPMLEFSPDGTSLVCAAWAGAASVWSAITGELVSRIDGAGYDTRVARFSPDGREVYIGGDSRAIAVADAATGGLLRVVAGLPWSPFDLKVHPDGKVLFVVGRGGELLVLDPHAGNEIAKLQVHQEHTHSLALSPDGTKVYTVGQDPWIGVVDLDRLRTYIRGNERYWRETLEARGVPRDEGTPRGNPSE